MANAVGSERVNLALTMQAEYYAGAGVGFVANGDDSCATNVSVVLSGFTENLAAGETCVLDSGWPGASGQGCAAPAVAGLQFAVPPVNGNFNFNLAAPGVGNTGGVTVTATVPDWLRFDWNAATLGEENPSGQATFGLFGGNARQIYLREIY
jgi:MSHA biogenesis protein MshQ